MSPVQKAAAARRGRRADRGAVRLRHQHDHHAAAAEAAATCPRCKGTITVATDLPLTGGDATDGPPVAEGGPARRRRRPTPTRPSAAAPSSTSARTTPPSLKNGHDPAQGAANITALASDQSVVGVVGPFNSSVAVAEIPVASQNHLALISPSNTNPGLTQVGHATPRRHRLAVPGAAHLLPDHRHRHHPGRDPRLRRRPRS